MSWVATVTLTTSRALAALARMSTAMTSSVKPKSGLSRQSISPQRPTVLGGMSLSAPLKSVGTLVRREVFNFLIYISLTSSSISPLFSESGMLLRPPKVDDREVRQVK